MCTGAQTKYALKYYNFINTGSSSSWNNINDWAKLLLVYWVSSSMTRIKAWKTVVELYILWSGGCPGFVSVQVLHRFSKTRSLFDSWKGSRLLRLTATRNLPLHCCSCLQQFKPRFFKSSMSDLNWYHSHWKETNCISSLKAFDIDERWH